MTTTSTHDTKRGEDAAARIAVLTEMPDLWRRTVRRWGDLLARFRGSLEGERSPSPVLEYQFYQTLVGAWPFGWDGEQGREDFAERMAGYLLKASKEAKQQTSWTTPNVAYDEAVQTFGRGALADDAFLKDARGVCESIATYAAANALGQCLLRLCSPGVPDTYQGSELWNQSLVDPDNRSAVDYPLRRRMLELTRASTDRTASIPDLLGRFEDGAIKLWLTQLALEVRRKNRELFLRGDYTSIAGNEHVVAFTRTLGASRLVCCATRFSLIRTGGSTPWAIGEVWGDERLALPIGRYRNELTGATVDVQGEVRLRDLLAELPIALLLSSS
jgi:(1->4)-alpha-D-glucan 1-alpha-D-glucosylmutase